MIILLLVTVGLLLFGGLAFTAFHHPQLVQPVLVGLTGLALLVTIVGLVASMRV
ncbi:hypothetical protein [Streptomyces spinosirectus]